jgi:hypothetical protein
MADLPEGPIDLADGPTDAPGTDAPGTDAPGTDTPGTDTPGTDAAATETSVGEASVADTSLSGAPTSEMPEPQDLVATEPANDDLLGELARAMHAAATSQYEHMNSELERRRAEQVEAIAARATAEAEQQKASTESDIGAIDAWAKAETEKIKQERLRRIDARKGELAAQLERQETIKQREVFAIEVAIDAHRTEIDQFFGRMERETDPTAIAQVASSLPPFPSLADIADEARRGATAEFESLDRQTDAGSPPSATDADAPTLDNTPDALVTESRLMAVMDPEASHGGSAAATPPWEAPSVVSVAAGSGATDTALEPEAHNRGGSTLLRTVRAIRPMAGTDRADADR